MDEGKVPQDQSRTYGGHKKLLYAKTDRGEYAGVTSTGWDAEETVTVAAVEELERLATDTWGAAKRGETSPLQYHMYAQRMDIALLSQVTGLFQWRIRRHFRPQIFASLPETILMRYGNALGVEVSALRQLPDAP